MASEPPLGGPAPSPNPPTDVAFATAFRVWLRIGLTGFGGPAGQIALMHRLLVEERKWVSEARFLHALNYCMLLPGPEAQQLAVYIGWLLHRTPGGLVAGILFVLPGAVVIWVLSVVYALFHDLSAVQAVFFGVKAAVIAVVVEAVLRIGRRALKNGAMATIAAAAFVAIFFLEIPFPAIVAGAALVGLVGGRWKPDQFVVIKGHEAKDAGGGAVIDAAFQDGRMEHTKPSLPHALRVTALWLAVWFAPPALLAAWLGGRHVIVEEGIFFSKMAVVTFGGAYAVLAYVAQQAVEAYGWLSPGEMLDGLGLAETTPGPLILVLQFVGFLAAYRNPGALDPMAAGTLGALLTTWVTFAPCFLWIFAGAPYVEALRGKVVLSAALSAITAAVVGVVLNLAVWFGLNVLFGRVAEVRAAGLRLLVPEAATLDYAAAVLAAAAFVAMLRFRVGMMTVLLGCAAAGAAYRLGFGL